MNTSHSRSIALATSGLGPRNGGIGVVSQQIASALEPLCNLSVWHHPHQSGRLIRLTRFGLAAFWGTLRKKPDVVIYEHVDLARIHPRIPGLRRVPYTVFLHGVEVWRPLDPGRRAILEGATLLLANSEYTVTQVRRDNPWLPRVQVTWLGISDPPCERPADSVGPVALMVGRMDSGERYKGHDQVLDAWNSIQNAVPGATLWIVGTGNDLERLQDRVKTEGLQGVEFRGWVDDEERARLYQTCRLFMFPSRKEGFGLAAIEAAAAGKPILALRDSVVEEVFPRGTGAIHVADQSGPLIAQAAIPLLKESRVAHAEGLAALQRMRETFREEHFATRFRKVFHERFP